MTSNAQLMVDLSSNNAAPNLPAHYKAGYRVLALKATEGTTYRWDRHAALANEWHKLGGTVWHYHFLHQGRGAQQADFFWIECSHHIAPGDRLVVDVEAQGCDTATTHDFINRCAQHASTPGLVYGSPGFLRSNRITPVHGWQLWAATYGPKLAFIPPGWKTWTAWQYSDRATGIPGMGGPVDLSRLAPPPRTPLSAHAKHVLHVTRVHLAHLAHLAHLRRK